MRIPCVLSCIAVLTFLVAAAHAQSAGPVTRNRPVILRHMESREPAAPREEQAASPGSSGNPGTADAPAIRLRAQRSVISSGEMIPVRAMQPGGVSSGALTWRADRGTVDATGMFSAPSVIEPVFTRIWACRDSRCGSTVVQVVPFRMEPETIVLERGESAVLKAWQGSGPVPAVWGAVTGNLRVSADGTVTAGAGSMDGGIGVLSATVAGLRREFTIMVRGPSGTTASTAELRDIVLSRVIWMESFSLGASATAVATKGDWIYVVSESTNRAGSQWRWSWLDAYHLDERRIPAWVGSVEIPFSSFGSDAPNNLFVEDDRLFVAALAGTGQIFRCEYDISSGEPALIASAADDPRQPGRRRSGTGVSVVKDSSGQSMLRIEDHDSGSSRQLPMDFQSLPQFESRAVGGQQWAAVAFSYFGAAEVIFFDVTGSTAQTIGMFPAADSTQLHAFGDTVIADGEIFQVSGKTVDLVAQIPVDVVVATDPATRRLLATRRSMASEGYRVVDVTNPSNPKVSAPFNVLEDNPQFAFGPDYIAVAGGFAGVQIAPTPTEGPRHLESFPASAYMHHLKVRDNYLYWTGKGFGPEGRSVSRALLEVVDLALTPSRVLAQFDRPGDQWGFAVELHGSYLYLGTDRELVIYDARNPREPKELKALAQPASSLLVVGNVLYAGSAVDGKTVLLSFDVTDPVNPRQIGSLPIPDLSWSMAEGNGWIAVALGPAGTRVYRTARPDRLELLSSYSGSQYNVGARGNLLYIAAHHSGLAIYDVSTTEYVGGVLLASGSDCCRPEPAFSVTLDARTSIAWLGTGYLGRVYGVDVRNPRSPRIITMFQTQFRTADQQVENTAIWNDRLIVAGNDALFDIAYPQNVGLPGIAATGRPDPQPPRWADQDPGLRPAQADSVHVREPARMQRFRESLRAFPR